MPSTRNGFGINSHGIWLVNEGPFLCLCHLNINMKRTTDVIVKQLFEMLMQMELNGRQCFEDSAQNEIKCTGKKNKSRKISASNQLTQLCAGNGADCPPTVHVRLHLN